jgi:4-amino-4-deoxy-L-arabinose transferase-like glycosyltransferase
MLPDEGRYVGVAWEMLRSGQWLTPTLDGLPFFHKPPLFYWITAGSMSLFGANEWAARAAPLLGAWLGGFSLYLFLRRWFGPRRAELTLVVLAVQPLFYVGSQFANLDMLVAGCITATVLCGAHAALCVERGEPYRTALAGAWALAAVGVLAKGLIGLVIPGAVLLLWLVALGRWRVLPRLLWWPGCLLFAVIALPWFAAMQSRYPDFLDYFFVVQHFKRFATGGFNNVEPFWFYPVVLALLSLPTLPWLARLPHPLKADPVRLLMALWVAVVVLFFSLPASKLLGYVLPAVPPLATLMTEGLMAAWGGSARLRHAGWGSLALSALVSLGVVVGLAWHPPSNARRLGAALASRAGPQDLVVALGRYPYDLPFYARLQTPIVAVKDWDVREVQVHDDWRKELADAGDFAPQAARSTLVDAAELPAALCAHRVAWLVGTPGAGAKLAFMPMANAVYADRDATLWKLDIARADVASLLRCPVGRVAGLPGP